MSATFIFKTISGRTIRMRNSGTLPFHFAPKRRTEEPLKNIEIQYYSVPSPRSFPSPLPLPRFISFSFSVPDSQSQCQYNSFQKVILSKGVFPFPTYTQLFLLHWLLL